MNDILPGDRVMAFDPFLFKDDVSTPLSYTVRPATVVARYGYKTSYDGVECIYDDLVDVQFDHRPEQISHGHFTRGVEEIV